jgi:integrase
MASPVDTQVAAINDRLKAQHCKIKVQLIGQSLYLRGTLPPKPGSGQVLASQQRIPLRMSATTAGLKRAEALARQAQDALTLDKFDWADWIDGNDRNPLKVSELVKNFEQHYRSMHRILDRTWRRDYQSLFNQLPQSEILSAELAKKLIESKPPDTRARKAACIKLQLLLDFAQISMNARALRGQYSAAKTEPRELPSDDLICEWRDRIKNPGWQWVFGIMAASGCRPHEAFFCEWAANGLQINQGKTGKRLINQLFYPEWVDQWNLRSVHRQPIDFEKHYKAGNLGRVTSKAFSSRGVPFKPYDLRHAAAIRMTAVFQLPIPISAALLGHTPAVHLNTYQKYITAAQIQTAVDKAINAADRPQAPITLQ